MEKKKIPVWGIILISLIPLTLCVLLLLGGLFLFGFSIFSAAPLTRLLSESRANITQTDPDACQLRGG